jgi:hypothetical protein
MSRENSYKYFIVGLVFLGAILRLTIFWVSPINNSFDDHLEVIKIYSENFNRPHPFQCWECYQPPLYYYVAAKVFNLTKSLGFDNYACWKIVQLINPLLSIILLIIAYKILALLNVSKIVISVILSFLIALPRDIMTSSMIGNDYMLVFFTIISFYCFLKTLFFIKDGLSGRLYFFLMTLFVTLGCFTKQHGLLLYLFPFSLLFYIIRERVTNKLFWFIPVLFISLFISFSDELWRFNKTGRILVSNQDYFDFAKNQAPGSLDKVEFFSFRIIELFKMPFLSDKTSSSFFTELFARTFYDYEWRFFSPKIPFYNTLGVIAYTLGLIWLIYFLSICFTYFKSYKSNLNKISLFTIVTLFSPVILSFLFMLVPVLQTIRFPYFSSMKSMFMLSGIILLIITLGSKIQLNTFIYRLSIIKSYI